jgi:ubiquinone/menaquinone biosynthesis C-methylase UbiE
MDHSYNTHQIAQAYQTFLASEDGKIFRDVVGKAFLARIPQTPNLKILDAGCGDGWLASLLANHFVNSSHNAGGVSGSSPNIGEARRVINAEVHACDAGEPLIAAAREQYPHVQFAVCDLNKPLPYQPSYFDIVTASMVLHDVEDELASLNNIAAVLKPGGKLLAAIVNPYYGYPIGEWKRGIVGRLLRRKPRLKLARSYNEMMQKSRPPFEWRPGLGSHFSPLSHHITAAGTAGLALTSLEDIYSPTDSPIYNLTYQLHRFPIILLLEFTKV